MPHDLAISWANSSFPTSPRGLASASNPFRRSRTWGASTPRSLIDQEISLGSPAFHQRATLERACPVMSRVLRKSGSNCSRTFKSEPISAVLERLLRIPSASSRAQGVSSQKRRAIRPLFTLGDSCPGADDVQLRGMEGISPGDLAERETRLQVEVERPELAGTQVDVDAVEVFRENEIWHIGGVGRSAFGSISYIRRSTSNT